MKRIILTAIIFLIIGGAAGYFLNPIINEKPAPTDIPASVPEPGKPQESGFAPPDKKEGDDESRDKELRENESIGRIDYPLIDIYFEKEKTYKITVQEYAKSTAPVRGEEKAKEYREYEDKGDFFQSNKEYFSVITVPSGRGTTPAYILKVYEGKKCIKMLDCVTIREGIFDDKWKS